MINDNNSTSGSDSNPQDDELSNKEMASIANLKKKFK